MREEPTLTHSDSPPKNSLDRKNPVGIAFAEHTLGQKVYCPKGPFNRALIKDES